MLHSRVCVSWGVLRDDPVGFLQVKPPPAEPVAFS